MKNYWLDKEKISWQSTTVMLKNGRHEVTVELSDGICIYTVGKDNQGKDALFCSPSVEMRYRAASDLHWKIAEKAAYNYFFYAGILKSENFKHLNDYYDVDIKHDWSKK